MRVLEDRATMFFSRRYRTNNTWDLSAVLSEEETNAHLDTVRLGSYPRVFMDWPHKFSVTILWVTEPIRVTEQIGVTEPIGVTESIALKYSSVCVCVCVCVWRGWGSDNNACLRVILTNPRDWIILRLIVLSEFSTLHPQVIYSIHFHKRGLFGPCDILNVRPIQTK